MVEEEAKKGPFNYHIGKADSLDCPECAVPETGSHIVFACRKYNVQRQRITDLNQEDPQWSVLDKKVPYTEGDQTLDADQDLFFQISLDLQPRQ